LGLWVWGWGVGVAPPTPNPQSPIPNPQLKKFFIKILKIINNIINKNQIFI